MTRRIRPMLLCAALLLTGLAMTPRAEAAVCVSGSWQWRDVGTCCITTEGETRKLLGFECAGGFWRFTRESICLAEPCTS
jgi:hypothetical protein